jgi:hypothetical protein
LLTAPEGSDERPIGRCQILRPRRLGPARAQNDGRYCLAVLVAVLLLVSLGLTLRAGLGVASRTLFGLALSRALALALTSLLLSLLLLLLLLLDLAVLALAFPLIAELLLLSLLPLTRRLLPLGAHLSVALSPLSSLHVTPLLCLSLVHLLSLALTGLLLDLAVPLLLDLSVLSFSFAEPLLVLLPLALGLLALSAHLIVPLRAFTSLCIAPLLRFPLVHLLSLALTGLLLCLAVSSFLDLALPFALALVAEPLLLLLSLACHLLALVPCLGIARSFSSLDLASFLGSALLSLYTLPFALLSLLLLLEALVLSFAVALLPCILLSAGCGLLALRANLGAAPRVPRVRVTSVSSSLFRLAPALDLRLRDRTAPFRAPACGLGRDRRRPDHGDLPLSLADLLTDAWRTSWIGRSHLSHLEPLHRTSRHALDALDGNAAVDDGLARHRVVGMVTRCADQARVPIQRNRIAPDGHVHEMTLGHERVRAIRDREVEVDAPEVETNPRDPSGPRRKRGPSDVVIAVTPRHPRRRPHVTGNPDPSIVGVGSPAAVVERDPAPLLFRHPGPSVVGEHPAAVEIGSPPAPHVTGGPAATVVVDLHPLAVWSQIVVKEVHGHRDAGLCRSRRRQRKPEHGKGKNEC